MATIGDCGTYEIKELEKCPGCGNHLDSTICHKCKSIWRFPEEDHDTFSENQDANVSEKNNDTKIHQLQDK